MDGDYGEFLRFLRGSNQTREMSPSAKGIYDEA